MLRFLLLLCWIGRFLGTADPSILSSAEGDVRIASDFSSIRIAKSNSTDYIYLNSEILHKSILNFGQLTPHVRAKLANNKCLSMMAFGTSVTCGNNDNENSEDRPRSAEDAWPHRLQEYMNTFLPACHSDDGKSSEHKFIRVHCACGRQNSRTWFRSVPTVCENSPRIDIWTEGILMSRSSEVSPVEMDLTNADIVFAEALDDFDYPYTGPGSARHSAKATERFIQIIERHKSQPSLVYFGASIQFAYQKDRLPSTPSQRSGIKQYDGVSDQLPVAKHYSVPYVSVIDSFTPFASDEMKQWWMDMFLSDGGVHPSRTGHKIDSLLLLYYLKQVQLSLQSPLSTTVETYKYLEVESVTPLHFTAQQLQEYVLDLHHQPLTIVLNTFAHLRIPYMVDDGGAWTDSENAYRDYKLYQESNTHGQFHKTSWMSDKVGGAPYVLSFKANVLSFHFHKQRIRVVVGKGAADMGSLQVQVRIGDSVISETVIDCLSPATRLSSGSAEGTEQTAAGTAEGSKLPGFFDFIWYSEEIHVASKLEITAQTIMNIYFTVVESKPRRLKNYVNLASITLL